MTTNSKYLVEPVRQKLAYGYCRVSTESQAKKGMSLEQQQKTIMDFFHYKLQPLGYAWGGFFLDPATSGKMPLLQRKSGLELSLKLEPEDCVIFAKLDRGFRSLKDMIETVDVWQARGVGVHMLDLSVDTTSDIGRLIMQILGAVAEFERKRISERIREAVAIRREKEGRAIGQAPFGTKWVVNHHGKKKLIRCEYTRRLMGLVVEYKEKGWAYTAIYFEWRRKGIRTKHGKEVSRTSLAEMYRCEMELRAKEAATAAKQAEKEAE